CRDVLLPSCGTMGRSPNSGDLDTGVSSRADLEPPFISVRAGALVRGKATSRIGSINRRRRSPGIRCRVGAPDAGGIPDHRDGATPAAGPERLTAFRDPESGEHYDQATRRWRLPSHLQLKLSLPA